MKGSGGMFSQPRADKCYGASNKLTPDIFVVSFYNLPSEIYTLVQWAFNYSRPSCNWCIGFKLHISARTATFSVEFFAKIKFWRTLFTESDMDSLAITSFVLWSDKGPKPMAGFKTKSLLRGSFNFGIWVETKWPVGFQMGLESIRKLFENQLALLVGPTQNKIMCVI